MGATRSVGQVGTCTEDHSFDRRDARGGGGEAARKGRSAWSNTLRDPGDGPMGSSP